MDADELRRAVEELSERVERLEGAAVHPPRRDEALVQRLLQQLEGDRAGAPGSATVVYAGAGPWSDGTVAWQIGRAWDEVLVVPVDLARVLSALANPTRLRVVGELLKGPTSTGELVERLDLASSGQLFHHLKELLAAGVVHQPLRGTYAIRRHHVVPLLAVLSAATDLAGPPEEEHPG